METKEQFKGLFSEFPPISTADWEALIFSDLKGAEYDKKLIWKTYEEIHLRPYYREEDIKNLEFTGSLPGKFPFVRGNHTQGNNWEIWQEIFVTESKEANKQALDFTSHGADGIILNTGDSCDEAYFTSALNGIDLSRVKLHLKAKHFSSGFLSGLENFMKRNYPEPVRVGGSLDYDPIGEIFLLENGDKVSTGLINETVEFCKQAKKRLPGFRIININGKHFQHAGASVVQEIAYTLGCGIEYMDSLTEEGFNVDEIAPLIQFTLAIGPDYFMQIAKLRALRLLWANIITAYKPLSESSMKVFVHSVTSDWNKTIYDPYVNLLRTTTEAMSAAIGGSDAITVLPFDKPFKSPDDFSNRIARNQQIILKEESWLDKVADPSAGSYYIEMLTNALAEKAWKNLQSIEENGGMIQGFEKGIIRGAIGQISKKKQNDIAVRKIILVGTNQFPNQTEKMLDKIEKQELTGLESHLTETYPLPFSRIATAFEKIRISTEEHFIKTSILPKVLLFATGNLTMRKARSSFALNFLGCAGYEIIDKAGFTTVEEGVATCKQLRPEIIVICSSDEEYPEIVPRICLEIKTFNKNAIIVLAGYPKEHIETFTNAGVDEFIHVRSSLVETLENLQKRLGIMR